MGGTHRRLPLKACLRCGDPIKATRKYCFACSDIVRDQLQAKWDKEKYAKPRAADTAHTGTAASTD